MTLEECRENQLKEKRFILKNKFTQVEIASYFKTRDGITKRIKWQLTGKQIKEFDANGTIVSCKIIETAFNGGERIVWQGEFVYKSEGICDSATTDKGRMQKVSLPYLMYNACYYGKRNLKNGLTIKAKGDKNSVSSKVVYTFK